MAGFVFVGIILFHFLFNGCPPPETVPFDPVEYSNFNLTYKGVMPSLFNITLIGKAYKNENLVIDLQSPTQNSLIQLQLDDKNLMVFLDDFETDRFPLPFKFNKLINIQIFNDGNVIHFYYKARTDQTKFTWLASFGHHHHCSQTGYKFLEISGGFHVDKIKINECNPNKIE